VVYDESWKSLESPIERRNQALFHSLAHVSRPIDSIVDFLYHFHLDSNFEVLIEKICETNLEASEKNVIEILNWGLRGYKAHLNYSIFAACRILKQLFSGAEGYLQECLCRNLDAVLCLEEMDLDSTHYLYSMLHYFDLFSYFGYLKKLVAAGSLEIEEVTVKKQFLLDFGLRTEELLALKHQRSSLGLLERNVEDLQNNLSGIKSEIMRWLGSMFANDGKVYGDHSEAAYSNANYCVYDDINPLKARIDCLPLVARLQISEWLKTSVMQYTIAALSSNVGSSALNRQQYCVIVFLFEMMEDFPTLLEINLWLIENSTNRWLFYSILSCLRKFRSIFCLLGGDEIVSHRIWERYQKTKPEYLDQSSLSFLSKWIMSGKKSVIEEYSNKIKRELEILEVEFF
jgi:hypothetical protein